MIRRLFIILCLFQLQQTQAQIYINEIQASNDTTLTGNFLEYDDWFELYNPTNSPINLAGYYLSDNIFQLTKFQIPNINASDHYTSQWSFIVLGR